MSEASPKQSSGRGLRLALAVSVALNLAVVGVVGGAMLRWDGPRGHGVPRDLGFGFFTEALTPENRADLRARLRSSAPGFMQDRQQVERDLTAILAALRAEPFDPDALDQAMQAQIERLRSRLDVGQDLLLDFLTGLSAADRLAFADRLEESAARKPPKRSQDGRTGP